MAPRKAQKMSLNAFLGDSSLGSWADEMDALPTAPAQRNDEDRSNDRRYGSDDFLSRRPDREARPPPPDVPLPTVPPYTAFVGNLAFDLTEAELIDFFSSHKTKSVKIIRDRDDKPKGFGYVEFEELEGLKDALTRNGTSFSNRSIRINVAEPPKERGGFGGFGDDEKFEGNWRREGPLPPAAERADRDGPRRRFDGPPRDREPPPPSLSDNASDWRSSRPSPRLPERDLPSNLNRRGPSFSQQEPHVPSPADTEEKWTIGSRFKPSAPSDTAPSSRFSSTRGPRGDMGPPKEPPLGVIETADWRSTARPRPPRQGSDSPNPSAPPTPQLGRRKLELLPRNSAGSVAPSPVASPSSASHTTPSVPPSRSNPFGDARPVDVSQRENEISERLAKKDGERSTMSRTSSRTGVPRGAEGHTMSRTNSRTASHRGQTRGSPPLSSESAPTVSVPSTPSSPQIPSSVSAAVRPQFSFASAASGKKDGSVAAESTKLNDQEVEVVAEKLEEAEISA